MVLGKVDIYTQNTEVVPLCHFIDTQNNSKYIIKLNIRAKTIKLLEENMGVNPYWSWSTQNLFRNDIKSTWDKSSLDGFDFIESEPFRISGMPSRCEMTTHRRGGNVCKLYI